MKGLNCSRQAQVWGQAQECSRWGCWCPGRACMGRQLACAHPRAGARSHSHPFLWAGEHRFRNSHDSQQTEWPSPSSW